MIRRNEYLTDTRKKTARLVIGMAAVFLLFFLMLPAVAFAEEAGVLAKIEGNVDILRAGETKAVPAMLNDTISIGDVIRTKSGGKVEIHFIDNTVLRLASGSRLKIDKYVFNPDKTRQSAAVTLFRGQLRAIVTKASGAVPASTAGKSTFNINTPTAVAGVLGTDLFVYHEGGVTGVLFKDGHGMVFNANNPSGAVPVSAGYVTFITGADADPLEPRPATDLELDQHIKATTTDGGTSGGGGTSDTPVVELFIDDSGSGGAAGDTFAPPPVNLIAADIIPVVTIYGVPPSATNLSTLNLSLVFSKAVTATYILNGIGIITPTGLWTDTLNVAGLAEGPQSLSIQVKDAGGNISQLYVINWTTDYTPPVTAILTAPPALTNTSNFGFTANEPIAYYSYSMDGGTTWVSSGSTLSLPAVDAPEGGNTIQVKSTDVAGNTSVGFDTYSWTTDYTPPSALALFWNTKPIRTGGLVYNDSLCAVCTINATATDLNTVSSYTYTLDGAPSTGLLTGLTEGLHTFAATATDAAGNTSVPTNYSLFNGARQYDLSGSVVDPTGAAVLNAWGQGRLNLISTGTQGAWQLDQGGTYSGTPSTSVVAAGTAYDSTPALDGYWIDKMDLAAGTSNLAYLSKTVYGSGTGVVIGGYDGLGGFSVADTGLGTYTETPLDFSGDVWGGLLWYDSSLPRLRYANASAFDNTPNVNGFIGLVGDLWSAGSAQAYLKGTYSTYSGAEPYLIYGSGWYMNYDPTMTGYANTLGGAFNGYNVGVWNNGVTKSNAVAIYIDPNGNAGYMQGGLDGAYYSGTGIWEMSGAISRTFVETTAILPADLVASLVTGHYGPYGSAMSGYFAAGGAISTTYMEGSLKGLDGHDWGVWNGGMAGNYDILNSSAFFVATVGASDFSYNGYSGYMLGSMASADMGAVVNTFTADLSARFMTPTLLGNMTTDGLYGTFDAATGTWQSSMVGTWQATPLAHVSDIYANAYYIGDPYLYGYSYSVYDGPFSGYFGGTDSLWASASTPVTFMGAYYPTSSASHIWGNEFGSYNYIDYTDTTYDNGAYHGYITGTEAGGALETLLYAVYVDDNNNVGYLKSGLSGSYYPSVGVFEQTGNIDRVEMSANTGITAANFYNSIYWGSGGRGALSGPSLSGNDSGLYTMTLIDPSTEVAQDWGLYFHGFSGQSASPANNWTAMAGGNDSIGVVNPYAYNQGEYTYSNGGYYYYRYNGTNTSGYVYYPRQPVTGEDYETIYNSDGTTWTNNYGVGGPPAGAGTWDTTTSLSSLLATPPDSANATLSYTNSYVGGTDDSAYWLMDVNGQSWANGELSATATGRYLSQTAIGTLTSDLAGVYDPATGAWSANGVGIYESTTPLAFSGIIDYADYWYAGPYYGLYGDDGYGYISTLGDTYGYIGGVTAPWSGAAVPVVYMGSYNDYVGPYIWNDDIYSRNVKDNTDTTFDNGAFHGFIGGVWNNNSINARAVSIYIDPDGNAGYLRGSLVGAYYPEITMFEADGRWTATQKTVAPLAIPQADFYSYTGSAYVTTSDLMSASVSGAFNGGNGGMNGGSIYGWTRYINGEDWGIYDLIIDGYAGSGYGYSNPDTDTVWSAKIGGSAIFGNNYICPEGCWWENDNGYYLADITAGTWVNGVLTGAMNGKFMSQTRMGTITGDVLGYYGIDSTGSDSWAATGLGVWGEGVPLAHSGVVATDGNGVSFYAYDQWGWLDTAGSAAGLMGGVTSPWSGTTDVTYMGNYAESGWFSAPYIWTQDIYSYNAYEWWSNTTFDNGMYKGFIGGIWKADGTIDAKVYSLYVDPAGNAGILKGGLTGAYYAGSNLFEADGQWTPTALASGVNVWSWINVVAADYGYSMNSSGSFNGSDTITVAGNEMLLATDWRYSISGQDWGISKSIIGGDYTGTPNDMWSLTTGVNQWQTFTGTQTDGTKWSADAGGNNVLKGETYGYGADITAVPKTWISVGETFGTFDATALTWQAAQSSAFINTSKYLAMMQTAEGQAALTQLNIPFVEVGTANLSGSDVMGNGYVTVNMNNVAFLAYSSGAAPKIWAAGDVNGAFTCDVCGGASVALSGNGLNTNFNITTFDTVTNLNWMATVNGGGTYSGTGTLDGSAVQMTGAAAGTIDTGLSTFTGTAAGTAQ